MSKISSGSLTVVDVKGGSDGINTATIYLYQRATAAPSKPSTYLTYTFANAELTGELGNWTQDIGTLTGSDPIWVIAAVASSNGTTDVIESTEWSEPIKMAQDGQNGQPGAPGQPGAKGLNQATVFIYKRAQSVTKPSDSEYTFETGSFTVTDGWQKTIPAATTENRNPCWVCTAVAIGSESSADLKWNTPSVLVENGSDGVSPVVTSTDNGVQIYDPVNDVTYTITNGINGTSYFTHILYSSKATPTSASDVSTSPTGKDYVGIQTTTSEAMPSWDDSGWQWVKYVGEDGAPATQYYAFVKYATNSSGANMQDTPADGYDYVGTYTGTKSNPVASDFNWSKYTGEPGQPATQYYAFIKYATSSTGANMTDTPTANTKYVGTYSGTKASPAASDYKWSVYVGTDGVSVTKTRELYYLKTNSDDVPTITPASQITATDRENGWTSVVPTYVANGTYYTCIETSLSTGGPVWSAPVENKGLTNANENAQGALSISRATQQHFWFVSENTGSGASLIEAGAYITDTPIDTFKNGKSGGYLLARSDGIILGKGTNRYMELSGSELKFYKAGTTDSTASTASNVAAKLSSTGLEIANGSITLGNYFSVTNEGVLTAKSGTIGGWSFTDNALYYSNVTPGYSTTNLVISKNSAVNTNAIAGSETNKHWFLAAGRNFGVDTDGVLYASGANIQGQVTITAGSNVYTKDEVDDAVVDATAELISAKEANGNIVHVEDASEYPALDCKISLEPIQDLNGYDKPWVGGAGKNLIDSRLSVVQAVNTSGTWNNNAYTLNGLTFTVADDGHITINGTSTANTYFTVYRNSEGITLPTGSYVLHKSGSADIIVATPKNGAFWTSATINDSVVSLTESARVSYYVQIQNGKTISNYNLYPMFEEGSTASDWSPYSNICPISGRTEVVTQRTGKNLLEMPFEHYTATASKDNCFHLPSGTYTFSFDSTTETSWRFVLRLYDADGNEITSGTPAGALSYRASVHGFTNGTNITYKSFSFTIESDAYVRVLFWGGSTSASSTFTDAQLELGTTATDYEPYQGETYTTALGRTVYGGTLDVVSGKLTVDRAYALLNDASKWAVPSGSTVDYRYNETFTRKFYSDSFTGLICSIAQVRSGSGVSYTARWTGAGAGFFGIVDRDGLTSLDEIKQLASNNEIAICYDIEPQTYQLTPQEVELLTGTNNVWSDGGDIHLKYVTMNSDMLSLMDKSNADLSRAKAEIKVTTDGISSEVSKKTDKDSIISTIRQSAETVKIKASQVEIDGTATFNAIKSQTDAAYDAINSASAVQTSLEAAAVAEEQYIYISKASGTTSVSKTTTWVTETGDKQNTWTTKRPTYNTSYPVLFVAKQKKVVNGIVTCTTPVKDDTTTIIDGGHITTGTIDSNRLNADTIKVNAANIQGSLTIGQLPSTVAETSDIPTKVSELTNDSGYQNSTQVSGAIDEVRSYYIADIDSKNGITIKAVNGTTSGSNTDTQNYIKLNADGLDIYKGGKSVAMYGDTARLGEATSARLTLGPEGLGLYDTNSVRYFNIESSVGATNTYVDRKITDVSGGTGAVTTDLSSDASVADIWSNLATGAEFFIRIAWFYYNSSGVCIATKEGGDSFKKGTTKTSNSYVKYTEPNTLTFTASYPSVSGASTVSRMAHLEVEYSLFGPVYQFCNNPTSSNGAYCFMTGNGVQTNYDYQTAVGRYNDPDFVDDGPEDYRGLFFVGGGASDAYRKNAMVVTHSDDPDGYGSDILIGLDTDICNNDNEIAGYLSDLGWDLEVLIDK